MKTLSLRDRRHQQAQKDFGRLERQRDETLDKLARIAAKLKATRRSIERYERTPKPLAEKPAASVNVEPPAATLEPTPYRPGTSLAAKIDDAMHGVAPVDLEIPDWLKRAGPIGHKTPADLKALAEIEADKKARAKAKAEKKDIVRSRKLGPDAAKMPLTGKAALAAIRQR